MITTIVYAAIMLILALFLLLKSFLSINVPHNFKLDKKIQNEKDKNQDTILFKLSKFVDPITATYIKRYTIVNEGRKRSCVVLYDEPQTQIKYYIYVYNRYSKLIDVLEIEERNAKEVSRSIKLSKKCRKINIKVVEVENNVVSKPLKRVNVIKLIFYSCLSCAFISMGIFAGMYYLFDETFSFNITTSIALGFTFSVLLLINLLNKNGSEVEN